ncbi:MAG TPA: choice-of-anchor D domain-containing protein, partial [Terriglobia bacterium]|nr:choice-of-anchor D domain-containing protein [Terriglobia bacterium]
GGPLAISSITFTGANAGDFTETDDCNGSVASGSTCAIKVTFTPSVDAAESATLVVTDNSGGTAGSTQTVALTGTGIGTTVSIAPASLSLDFGSEIVGATSAPMTVTVKNTGKANLTFSLIELGGTDMGDFAVVASVTPCSTASMVAPGASCTIELTFKPTATGARSGTLVLDTNTPSSPQSISLTGNGVSLQAAVQSIIGQVNTLYAQGALNAGQDNSLVKELQDAINAINAGKINKAIGNLESFITEVNDLESSGVLTSDLASPLVNAAKSVIAQLQAMKS